METSSRLLKNSLLMRSMDGSHANQTRKCLIWRSRVRACTGLGALKKARKPFFNNLPEHAIPAVAGAALDLLRGARAYFPPR
ncbi:MAG: hypothetical protein JSS44_02165 [Proteobacteria bacterium]|nr:hypothetical protein [Pseudomonadota bacterium]MBS0461036.1 hypothetical protein [Pseudomonadota bacterium]